MTGRDAHIDTTRQVRVWELELKVELVCAFRQPAIAAEDELILEERSEAIAKVFRRLLSPTIAQIARGRTKTFAGRDWILKHLRVAMERHNHVGNARRAENT